MNKRNYLLPLWLLVLVLTSCSETKEENKYHNWRARNDAFIDSLQAVVDAKTDPQLLFFTDEMAKSKVYYKKIKGEESATGDASPLYTSTVEVYYRGMFIDEEVFGLAPSPRFYTKYHKELTVFDQSFAGDDPDPNHDTPVEFGVGSVITGWTWALQHMLPGERWEIYIPYASAYGKEDKDGIPHYSTLIFDVELVDITKY